MRAVVQRVDYARVLVNKSVVGQIEGGLLVFVGIEASDNEQDLMYISDKITNLRIFPDAEGKMNLSVLDVKGQVLIVSQFTLYGDCRRGRRPSFTEAASPEFARLYYEKLIRMVRSKGVHVENGVFQAHMEVELKNNGPVTILLDSSRLF